MPRHKCCKKIGFIPEAIYYRPDGQSDQSCDAVILTLDEFEAIRLADFAGLYQEDAAGRMNISRQTFGRIIESAHKKIADVLVNGKALRIEGGNVKMDAPFRALCDNCNKSVRCGKKFQEGLCPRMEKKALKK